MGSIPQAGIYIIKNIVNGKVYLGQTNNLRKRWYEHKRKLRLLSHDNNHLQASWNKHGEKAFKFLVLEYCQVDVLDDREQHYLDSYVGHDSCYNIAKDVIAPMRGKVVSEETKRKMSESQRGRPGRRLTEEEKRMIGERSRGNKNMLGKPRSEETRRKISEGGKRRAPASQETRRKIGDASRGRLAGEKHPNFGKHRSEETRRKISEALRGKPGRPISEEQKRQHSIAMTGRVYSEETLRKMSEAAKRREALKREQKATDDGTH